MNSIMLVFYEDGMKKTQIVTKDEARTRIEEAVAVVADLAGINFKINGSAILSLVP